MGKTQPYSSQEVHSSRGHGRWKFQLDVKEKNIPYNKTGQKLVQVAQRLFFILFKDHLGKTGLPVLVDTALFKHLG